MSAEEEKKMRRHRRNTAEKDFITSSIDSLLSSHYKNQDAVLEHQTEMIRSLVKSQNFTSQIDSHFFNIIDEIRSGYSSLVDDINARIVDPMCPTVTPVMYILALVLVFSGLLNAAFVFYFFQKNSKS